MLIELPIPDRGPTIDSHYSVRPDQITLSRIDSLVFEDAATADSARLLLRWANHHGCWKPFTQAQIDRFLIDTAKGKCHGGVFHFEALMTPRRRIKTEKNKKDGRTIIYGGGWIKLGKNGYFHFTTGFVEACYRASNHKPKQI